MARQENNEPKSTYAVYRIDKDCLEDCIKSLTDLGYSSVTLKDGNEQLSLLVHGDPPTKQPRWVKSLLHIAQDHDLLRGMRNHYASFALFFETEKNVYVTTGGIAGSIVRQHCSADFGLDIGARVLRANRLLSIRQKPIAGQASQEETTYRRRHDISLDPKFRGKIAKEIICELEKADIAESLNLQLKDKDVARLRVNSQAFTLQQSLSLNEFKAIATACDELLEKPESEEFALFRGYKEVRGKEVLEKLKGALAAELAKQYEDFKETPHGFVETTIGLSYDNPKDLLLCNNIHYEVGSGEAVRGESLSLWHLFHSLRQRNRKEFKPSYLTSIHISGTDEDGRGQIQKGTLYSFLFAELTSETGKTIALVDGKWYEMTEAFRKEVDEQVKEIIETSASVFKEGLPSWAIVDGCTETEPSYTQRICNSPELVQMHGHHVAIQGGGDKSEVCDVLDRRVEQNRLIYVKKGFGSYLREGLGQTRTSSQLLARDRQFQANAKAKITEVSGSDFAQPTFESCDIVLAVADHSTKRQDADLLGRLTTVVKLDLIETAQLVRGYGFRRFAFHEVKHSQPAS